MWLKSEDMKKLAQTIDHLKRVRQKHGVIVNTIKQLEAMQTYFQYRDFPFKYCCAGDSIIGVNVNGEITLCPFMKPIGNLLHDKTLLWNGPKAIETRKSIKRCRKLCGISFCFYEKNLLEKVNRLFNILNSGGKTS